MGGIDGTYSDCVRFTRVSNEHGEWLVESKFRFMYGSWDKPQFTITDVVNETKIVSDDGEFHGLSQAKVGNFFDHDDIVNIIADGFNPDAMYNGLEWEEYK